MTSGQRWTAQEDDALRRMLAEGRLYADIFEELGKSYHAVRRRARRLKITPCADALTKKRIEVCARARALKKGDQDTARMRELIRDLAEKAMTNAEIAQEIGSTISRVSKDLGRMGFVRSPEIRRIIRIRTINGDIGTPVKAPGRRQGCAAEMPEALEKAAIARGSAELRDRVLALYRRERMKVRRLAA